MSWSADLPWTRFLALLLKRIWWTENAKVLMRAGKYIAVHELAVGSELAKTEYEVALDKVACAGLSGAM